MGSCRKIAREKDIRSWDNRIIRPGLNGKYQKIYSWGGWECYKAS